MTDKSAALSGEAANFPISPGETDTSYVDEKGRTRWRRNDQMGQRLKELGEFLVIGGYEESHAARYPRLAHDVSRYPESVVTMHREDRLRQIPGIGETIAGIVGEILDTGTCRKIEEWAEHTPKSVMEMTSIPGLGAKTIKLLFQEYGIVDLATFADALEAGRLDGVKGLGPKTLASARAYIAENAKK
jgi:DNA polymerase (family 10)